MNEWYQSIDVLLVTAGPEEEREAGPLPPFEAIASGVLVIGTNVGNFQFVPGPKFSTIEEAATILNALKKDPETIRQISAAQYDFVMQNYTFEICAQKWAEAFEDVIQTNHA